MDNTLRLGWRLAETTQIEPDGDGGWRVLESPGSKRKRTVFTEDVPGCDCDAFWKSGECPHFWAVCISLARWHDIPIPRPQKKRQIAVRRDWQDVNRSFVDRQDIFCRVIHAVTRQLPDPPRGRGRRRISMKDMVQLLAYKAHMSETTRGASGTSLLTPYLSREINHRTISKYAGLDETAVAVMESIVLVAREFQPTETFFAADASTVPMLHTDKYNLSQDVALHVICGIKSKAVFAAEVTKEKSRESKFFVELLRRVVGLGFNVKAVAADKAYQTLDVQAALKKAKAVAYIPRKAGSKKGPTARWDADVQMALNAPKLFKLNYGSRNIVEGVFGNIETTMGKEVRVRKDATLRTEVLSMVLAHNVVCLINAIYREDFDPSFPRVESKHKPPRPKPMWGPGRMVNGEWVPTEPRRWP